MIKGTVANCKIKSITISNFTAYINCVIYSTAPAKEHKGFKFYLRDKNKKDTLISTAVYWIDRTNNYINDVNNIDVNKYLEVLLKVNIPGNEGSTIIENKWVMQCNLILKDISAPDEVAWASEELSLISKEFEIPTLTDLDIYSSKDYTTHIDFKYNYKSQQDFNYNNSNLYTYINIRSVYTNILLEQFEVSEEDTSSTVVKTKTMYPYTTHIKIEIVLKNLKGDVLNLKEIYYNPLIRDEVAYIRTEYGVKKVLAFYVKEGDVIKGGNTNGVED